MITKTDFDAKISSLNRKVPKNKTRHLLIENELNKLKTFDSRYFIDKSHFEEDGITPPSAPNSFLNPSLNYLGTKIRVRFGGSCLKQDKSTYTHGKIVNIYIVYGINKKYNTTSSDPTLENCLFGAVILTKNADIDMYGYSGYGIGFDKRSSFLFSGGGFRQNILILGADMSSSAHVDNNKKDILVLGKGPKQRLKRIEMYSINFTEK